jgi:hypothetical protein
MRIAFDSYLGTFGESESGGGRVAMKRRRKDSLLFEVFFVDREAGPSGWVALTVRTAGLRLCS